MENIPGKLRFVDRKHLASDILCVRNFVRVYRPSQTSCILDFLYKLDLVLGYIFLGLKSARIKTLSWAGQRPMLALTLVILISGILLPLVSAAALMPIVGLIRFGNYLESKGPFTVMYAIFCQGLILVIILVILFLIAFILATGASILHSYNFFQPIRK